MDCDDLDICDVCGVDCLDCECFYPDDDYDAFLDYYPDDDEENNTDG